MKGSVRSQILNDPYYRLQSLAEVRLAAELGVLIDVNRACVDDWLRLPGLSIHQARSLAALSQSGVQFHAIEDIAAALSLPVARLLPLSPVLQFCYYDSESPVEAQPISPNLASAELLIQIPAIDLFLARAIVQNRQAYGAYRSLADLQRRLALPGQLTADLMHYLRF
ncbi:MAG: ComEA family DNA-binding protein [Drouetiella hepatica Uher 2000/2452]|jgi:DNA uptake protein ComE-like DNA-binding protein|uniref:ComEA family DNA-binding protein n=1 Tax=Drouetiella hepatica Uher 2000/2452 TaxID=904376 RepID=A0A951Q9Z4_9CYAN|nr:ComEA family DNA-binding protein [Drouetiella hepatica Uher 2000/2452]